METAYDPEPVYRRACASDLTAIADLEATVFQEPYRYFMLRQLYDLHGEQWLVAELGSELIGYALLLEKNGRSLLFTFAVVGRLQHRGFGRALLDHAVRHCCEVGAEEMYLTVRPDNQPAFNMFKQAGFESVEYNDQYFGPGEPRRVMRRWLRHR